MATAHASRHISSSPLEMRRVAGPSSKDDFKAWPLPDDGVVVFPKVLRRGNFCGICLDLPKILQPRGKYTCCVIEAQFLVIVLLGRGCSVLTTKAQALMKWQVPGSLLSLYAISFCFFNLLLFFSRRVGVMCLKNSVSNVVDV